MSLFSLKMTLEDEITSELYKLELCTAIRDIKSLSGGSISNAARYTTDKGDYFVKVKKKLRFYHTITIHINPSMHVVRSQTHPKTLQNGSPLNT